MQNLYDIVDACLEMADPSKKCEMTANAYASWQHSTLSLSNALPVKPIGEPGRPLRPVLVRQRELNSRKLGSEEGHAALIHSITHIEFNAINLALDAVYRFRDMPEAFYTDWLRVAKEEAYHFQLLRAHLSELGYDYGDFDAHHGLWQMAQKTAHDGMIRMALVPRVLEARGLDVTPAMIKRLKQRGDQRAVDILDIILRDEIGHVEVGTRWFRYYCKQRELDSESTFSKLIKQYMSGKVNGPFHYEARRQAGFSEQELTMLDNQ